ncbi:MAG TPA: hypothetical protein VF761_13060 [Gemmatimonadaceae bacterium]
MSAGEGAGLVVLAAVVDSVGALAAGEVLSRVVSAAVTGAGAVVGAGCWHAATANDVANAAHVMKRVTYSPCWMFAN